MSSFGWGEKQGKRYSRICHLCPWLSLLSSLLYQLWYRIYNSTIHQRTWTWLPIPNQNHQHEPFTYTRNHPISTTWCYPNTHQTNDVKETNGYTCFWSNDVYCKRYCCRWQCYSVIIVLQLVPNLSATLLTFLQLQLAFEKEFCYQYYDSETLTRSRESF